MNSAVYWSCNKRLGYCSILKLRTRIIMQSRKNHAQLEITICLIAYLVLRSKQDTHKLINTKRHFLCPITALYCLTMLSILHVSCIVYGSQNPMTSLILSWQLFYSHFSCNYASCSCILVHFWGINFKWRLVCFTLRKTLFHCFQCPLCISIGTHLNIAW